MAEGAICVLCGEPMPEGETMFKYHGYSGPCPKPPLPKPAKEETGWVIEHGRSQPSHPMYWCADGFDHNNLKAIRFARKEDAERVANSLGGGFPEGYHRIADHMWCP
jgi:hypothetical protein